MGETTRSSDSNSDEQKHSLFAGGAVPSRGEHVQPQDGTDAVHKFDSACRGTRQGQH